MIEFGYQLSYYLNQILKKHNNNYGRRTFDSNYCVFSCEEIKKITKLELDCIDDITGLENLKNLKELIIQNKFLEKNNVDFSDEINYPYNSFKDFSTIENLENLETLCITDNMFLRTLDLKKLKKLKKLIIFNTPNLVCLENLETLKNLETVFICGTSIKNSIDFKKYSENTKNCKENLLDIQIYPHFKNYNYRYSSIKFVERIGQFDFVVISRYKVDKLFTNCINIIKKFRLLELSKEQQISIIYKYVLNYVKFDYSGLQRRYKIIKHNPKTIITMKNHFGMLHSSYNALIKGKSNCEGYVNLMKFLMGILGINCYNVHCKLKRDRNINTNNHSIIKIEYNGKYGYCDPSLEQKENNDYFFKSFDDIKKTHSLSLFEEINYRENRGVKENGCNYSKHFKQTN